MSSEVTPKIPERPSRRKTSELFPPHTSETGDTKANSEPPTPAEKPNIPTRRPMLKAKTMTSFESSTVSDSLPQVPLQRPIRRSTTEELNNVMNNTSKELEEIESLISKHNAHTVCRKKSPTTVREGEVAAIHQNDQGSALGDKNSSTPESSPPETNEHMNDGGNESAVPFSDLINSSNYETTERSDPEDRTGEQKVHAVLDDEAGYRSDFGEMFIPGDMTLPVNVGKDVGEDSFIAQPSPGIVESDDKAGKLTKLPESSFEELQEHQEQQEEKLFQNPIDEKSTTSLNEKRENKDNTEVNPQPNRPSTSGTITPATNTNIPSQPKSEEDNDVPLIPRSRPKKDIEASVQKEELPNVEKKLKSEEHDSSQGSTGEESRIPKVPSERPKRRAPPVPKKPSSRIAAFQEMLQKQQQQDLHNNGASPATTASTDIAKKHTDSYTASSSTKADFTNKLNGLFALPGMVNPGQIPPSLDKKLCSPDAEPTVGKKEQPQAKNGPLGNTRRARGPRGRKLPSKVASVEKVEEDDNTNKIEIFNNWNVYSFSSKQKNSTDTTPSEQLTILSGEQAEKALDEKAKSISEAQPEQSPNEVGTASTESVSVSPLSQTAAVDNRKAVSEESLSPSEAIANRDQDDTTEIQEQQMENQMEADMERELSGDYEDIDSALHSEEASFHSL